MSNKYAHSIKTLKTELGVKVQDLAASMIRTDQAAGRKEIEVRLTHEIWDLRQTIADLEYSVARAQ